MPPKRKRAGGARGSLAAVAVDDDSSKEIRFFAAILSEWKDISHDKTRSMELVTALVDNQCLTPGIPDHADAYWLVLATQAMNQLVQYLENQHGGKQKQQVAAILAHLCHSVATAMMVDKAKLEKLTLKHVRSVVGRAMVSLAVGALTAMPYTSGKSLWASVLALDMVIFQQPIKATPTVDGWHVAQLALTAYVEDDAVPDCDAVSKFIVPSSEETACLTALMHEPPTTPSKRLRRNNVTSPTDEAEESHLHTVFGKLDLVPIEGRVSMRRWSSMALVWLANGQERILQFCVDVLQRGDFVEEVPARTVGTPTKKSKKPKLTTLIAMPAKVAMVTLVSRLMVVLAEAVTNGGSRPPTGGMDTYVQTRLTKKKSTKVDVRDIMVVTMYALLGAHADCLPDCKLVNDDESNAISQGIAHFCPFVHKALESLCRAESISSRKLLTIAACYILQLNIFDAKLCTFAVGQFHNCFSSLLDGRGTDGLEQSFKLLRPLPPPALPKTTKKNRMKDEDCSFAGLLEKSLITDQPLLPLYFRAMETPDAIYSLLLDMLEACYDVNTTTSKGIGDSSCPTASKKGKKKNAPQLHKNEPLLRRLNATRAGLASDACNVFRCLTTQHSLQAYFRSCLAVEQLCRFVRVAATLETILTTTSSDAKSRDAAASFFHPSSSDFNLYERTLWSSHTNLCYTLGQGTLLHSSVKRDDDLPILGDAGVRLTVFQEIAKSCGTKDWPLHLPASYHALLATNMTSEPVKPGKQEPEEFLVRSMIRSISKALVDPAMVTHAKWLGSDDGDQVKTTDERAPLSFRDARLLMVALSRLPSKDQLKHVTALGVSLAMSLVTYRNDDTLRKTVIEHGEVSQFLARTITTYTFLLNLLTSDLRDILFEQVGNYQYPLPPLYTVGSILNGVVAKDGNWYKKESCFVGLLVDWESPAIPTASKKMLLPDDIIQRTSDILEHALSLGFQCAPKDYGQLLFAAWNASGRKLTWDSSRLKDLSIRPFNASGKALSTLFNELRDDICNVHLQFHHNSRASLPTTLLGETLKTARLQWPLSLKDTLCAMLAKACCAVQHLLETDDSSREFEAVKLALLEALPVYIAFIMSMHTSTADNIFSKVGGKKRVKSGRKRRRLPSTGTAYDIELLASIMSDEDSGGSDDDYEYQEGTEDTMMEGLAHLHDACNLFGAAPVFPDWLDSNCCFRESISADVAGQNAAIAIECLTTLGKVANAEHNKAVKKCMAVLAGHSLGDQLTDTAASLCCLAIDNSNAILSCGTLRKENDFQEAIATVFEIQIEAIQDFYNDSASSGWRAAKEAWIPNCPQQIIGLIQSQSIDGIEASNGEYRAGGDWEMLLAEALAGSCTGCGMKDSDQIIWKSIDVTNEELSLNVNEIFDANVREERWLRISQCVVSQLMPAAALLRFSAASGYGRDQHPLSFRDGTQVVDLLSFNSSAKERDEFPGPLISLSEPHRRSLLECVTFLVRRSARSNGDDLVKRSCFAVASNLLVEAQPSEDIEGIEAILMAFETLGAIANIISTAKHIDENRLSSFRFLIKSLINMLKVRGRSPNLSKVHGKESEVLRILACVGSGTLVKASVLDVVLVEKGRLFDNENNARECALNSMVFVLCCGDSFVENESRSIVASLIGELVELEGTFSHVSTEPDAVRGALLRILSSLDSDRLEKMIELAYPQKVDTVSNIPYASETARGVSKLLALVLSCDKSKASVNFCRKVFTQLHNRMEKIESFPESIESSLGVLFVYAYRVGCLDSVGTSLVERLSTGCLGEAELAHMECFLSFVEGLRMARRTDTTDLDESAATLNTELSKERKVMECITTEGGKPPRACSHVLRNGFFHQHWYNCYTCGLVFDKGCCTLCALVCHKGHEVAYSRSSSFFCDCGADVASAGEQNRVVCKCISPLTEEEAGKLFRDEKAKNYLATTHPVVSDSGVPPIETGEPKRVMDLFVKLALSFDKEASTAVEQIKAAAIRNSWVRTAFGLLADQSQKSLSTDWVLANQLDPSVTVVTRESVIAGLVSRSGIALDIEHIDDLKLVPIRAARAGSFNLKMSLDSTTDRVKRTTLARHGIVRSAVVADSRGRLIIAEPSSLVFCSVIPVVNTRFIDDPVTTQIGRSQMTVIASHALSFNVVGMRFSKESERHVIVWGTTEACVVVLKRNWSGVERTFTLEFDLDPQDCESDYLVRCDWVPGSQTHVSVSCGTFVKIYSIASADGDDNVTPLLSYSVAYEAVVKDTAWVSVQFSSKNKRRETTKRTLTLFLLMDTGRLHEVQLQLDCHGEIEGHGSLYIERSSRCVDIPTVGVRPYEGVTPGKSGSSTRSMGEGCSLCFLPQSNVLLYKCVSSCVVALTFDDAGGIKGSFELLPNRVDAEVLGNGTDGYSIAGPFTHWTEMGVVDGSSRLVCIGKSSRTNQPKVLCIDVNRESVKVKEIIWSAGGSVGLGLSLSSSFEGLAVFSVPFLSVEKLFDERLYLSVVTSNGSILIYGEETNSYAKAAECPGDCEEPDRDEILPTKPPVALTIYEDLLNVSDVDELRFAGDGVGRYVPVTQSTCHLLAQANTSFSGDSDSIKAKLSPKTSIYLMSPARDGCTITVALNGPVEMSQLGTVETPDLQALSLNHGDSEKHKKELAIIALRLLVGSTTTDCVPSRVFIQGRPFELKPQVKRWYDIPLTMEEVVLAVRNGFVSIGLGPAFESGSNPLVDAFEVYAVERIKVQHFIPTSLETNLAKHRLEADVTNEGTRIVQSLVLKTRILSFLYRLVSASLDQNTQEGKSLKHLIRSTALNEDSLVRENVVELIERVENDGDLRQKFLDQGTILGVSEALQVANMILRTAQQNELESKYLGRKMKILMDARVVSVTSIALSRPGNYVTATVELASEGLTATSMAINSSDILLSAIKNGIPCSDVIEPVVHLVLAELSIAKSHIESADAQFATFPIISKLLTSEHQDVIERCCEAITSFVDLYNPSRKAPVSRLFNSADADHAAPIAYQCDSCSKFPITDSRYTLLEDDHDIDLCTKCYQVSWAYAEGVDFSANSPVIVNGRSIGGITKLTCAQIKQMESVPIANGTAIAEKVEKALQEAKAAGPLPSDGKDRLHHALQRSQPVGTAQSDKFGIDFDRFTDGLFDSLLGLVGYMLEKSSAGVTVGRSNPLLTLLLDSISMGANETAHISRGKRYAREVLKHTRRMLGTTRCGPRSDKSRYILLINFLRSLSRLTGANGEDIPAPGDEISESGVCPTGKLKSKTDPRFVCDVHGVAAVRRRCSTGGNKNKRFYVCGMDRKQRCKYFKWADDMKPTPNERIEPQTRLEKDLELFTWQLLSDVPLGQTNSLSDKLCDLMETEFARSDGGKAKDVRPAEVKSCCDQSPPSRKTDVLGLYDREAAVVDFQDGVFCSKEKMNGMAPYWLCKPDLINLPRDLLLPDGEYDDQILSDKFVEASLDLVSTVACASSSGELQVSGHTRWFSLLCEVISLHPASRFRPQAKKALKRMCGGNPSLFHRVRDHYVFCFQFKEILHHAKSALDGALCVREQARQCGEKWHEEDVSWSEITAGELLGTIDLVPEDCQTVSSSKRIGAILDELLLVTKTRVDNWRNFCSLLSLPLCCRQRPDLSVIGQERLSIERTFGGPPILTLFWLSCSISGINQVKVMKLIDSALTSDQERRSLSSNAIKEAVGPSDVGEVFGENIEGIISDAVEVDADDVSLPFTAAPQQNPEDTLVNGPKALSVDDIFAFSIEFVLRGRTVELRRIGSHIASKLCRHLSTKNLVEIFSLLIDRPTTEIEGLGCSSIQYLQLLQSIIKVGDWQGYQELALVGKKVAVGFTKQMTLFSWARGKGQFLPEGLKRFELSSCAYCHRIQHPAQKSGHRKSLGPSKDKKTLKDTYRNKTTDKGSVEVPKVIEPPWLPDQVRPFVRDRLENSTENTCSSEFAVFVQLKCRLAISEIHCKVNEPRGRYVKTIVVFFTPRQVAEVNELKSYDYDHLWQECATLSLKRGDTHISCNLPIAVTVANLKFEYRDFYDRAGGSRAVDGSLVLFCPRCSRQVNNAHGVCGSCGECVFQCRRCRQIQYDRPDAFLCTECGHCSSGSFSYEINAGISSNAVAIVDDESYKRMVKVWRVANKLHGDLNATLVERLRVVSRKRLHPETDALSEYSPAMKRALMGDLPKLDEDEKVAGASVSDRRNMAINVAEERSSNAANRARSLLRFLRPGRHLRNDGNQVGRSRELMLREAFLGGLEFSLEEVDDDEADIVGLFGTADRSDTLTRLVATITGRRNAERINERAITETTNVATRNINTSALTNKDSTKTSIEECEKLYQLMREAERECYELKRHLDAWDCLERDCLKVPIFESKESFAPTRCSRCAGPLTFHFLLLMLRLVQTNKMEDIMSVINKEFVHALFLEAPQMPKDLFDLKGLAITTLCLKSEHAAKLILEEIRSRLCASNDEAAASILGKLLEHDFPLSGQFLALATETLDSTYMM